MNSEQKLVGQTKRAVRALLGRNFATAGFEMQEVPSLESEGAATNGAAEKIASMNHAVMSTLFEGGWEKLQGRS